MEKLYYSIAEVAELLGESQSTLRFWETEFTQINLRKNKKGTRFYKDSDIQQIKNIQFLLREQKLTIQGAKERLRNNSPEVEKKQLSVEKLKRIRDEIVLIQRELRKLDVDSEEAE